MAGRLFLALWPPAHVQEQVAAAIAPLQAQYPAIHWQPAPRWHITLAFLGERGVQHELRRLSHFHAVGGDLRLSGSGIFGPVLWLGVTSGGWLDGVARRAQKHFDSQDRRFRGHLTIARARSSPGRRELDRAARDLAPFESSPWTAMHLTLMQSTTSYEVLAEVPLAPAEA